MKKYMKEANVERKMLKDPHPHTFTRTFSARQILSWSVVDLVWSPFWANRSRKYSNPDLRYLTCFYQDGAGTLDALIGKDHSKFRELILDLTWNKKEKRKKKNRFWKKNFPPFFVCSISGTLQCKISSDMARDIRENTAWWHFNCIYKWTHR